MGEKLQQILDEPQLDSQKLFDEIVQIVEDKIHGEDLVPEQGDDVEESPELELGPESEPVENGSSPAPVSAIISAPDSDLPTITSSQRPLRPATTVRDELKINHGLLPDDPNLLIQKLQRSKIFADKKQKRETEEKDDTSLFKDLIEDLIRFSLLIKSGWSDWTAYLFVKIL